MTLAGRGVLLPEPASGQAAPTSAAAPAPAPGQSRAFNGRTFGLVTGVSLVVSVFLDQSVRDEAQENRSGFTNGLADAGNLFGSGQFLGPVLGGTFLAALALGDPQIRDATGHAALAGLLGGGAATVLKFTVGRRRPREGGEVDRFRPFRMKDSSFPSGHTALAFAIATALASETGDRWSDALFYGGAALTGLARVNDDRHWLSDVVGGAAIGYAAGRWVTRGHRKVRLVAVPGGVGLSF